MTDVTILNIFDDDLLNIPNKIFIVNSLKDSMGYISQNIFKIIVKTLLSNLILKYIFMINKFHLNYKSYTRIDNHL